MYKDLLAQAKKEIEMADHMCFVTFPLVNETKFLLSILSHITSAAKLCLKSLLEFDKKPAGNNPFSELYAYKELEQKYKLDPKYFRLLQKLFELQRADLESNIRFKRGEKYILSLSGFEKITILDINLIKRYLLLTKKFISDCSNIILTRQNV